MALYHVNFHTLYSKSIFEDGEYDTMMRGCLRDVLRVHKVICLAWELMPTHVHMIVQDFPDRPRGVIVKCVKGSTSHAFFAVFPDLRDDLLGGHLWTKGYYFAEIMSHQQFLVTLNYVRTNRARADLPPPAPLQLAQ